MRQALSKRSLGLTKPLFSEKVKGALRKIRNLEFALAQARKAFGNVDENGEPCSNVCGASYLAHTSALLMGRRAVAALIHSLRRS